MNVPSMVEAAIPLAASLGLGWYGFVRRAPPDEPAARTAKIRRFRWLGPLLFLFAIWQLGTAATSEPPPPDAKAIAAAMRARLSPPKMLDDVTRLDDLVAVGRHVIFQATITTSLDEAQREALLAEQARTLRARTCGEATMRKYVDRGLGFEWEYTIGGKRYPAIVVGRAECGL